MGACWVHRMKSGFIDHGRLPPTFRAKESAVRKHLIPPAIAAALAARARVPLEAGIPLYLPAYDDRPGEMPAVEDAEEPVVDASGLTIGDEEDDDFY